MYNNIYVVAYISRISNHVYILDVVVIFLILV